MDCVPTGHKIITTMTLTGLTSTVRQVPPTPGLLLTTVDTVSYLAHIAHILVISLFFNTERNSTQCSVTFKISRSYHKYI